MTEFIASLDATSLFVGGIIGTIISNAIWLIGGDY